MDPIYLALGGAVVSLAGVVFRLQEVARKRAEEDALFWRDRALRSTGLAEVATAEAEKRSSR